MRLSLQVWVCGAVLLSACTDSVGALSRPCADGDAGAPLGIRTGPAELGRGIWFIERMTAKPLPGQSFLVTSRAGQFELMTDFEGWAQWPAEIAAGDTIDLMVPQDLGDDAPFSEIESVWLGLRAGCVAVESIHPLQSSGRLAVPSSRRSTVQGKLRVDTRSVPMDGQYVLSYPPSSASGSRRQVPVTGAEVLIDVEVWSGRSKRLVVFALPDGDLEPTSDWSNVRGWGGASIPVDADAGDGEVVGELALAPLVQD